LVEKINMAKKKKKGAPIDPNAWMVTFSDLMTLLLTFFVLLLTMKSMDQKALKSMFSVFSGAIGMFGFGEKSIMVPEPVLPPKFMRIDAETLRKLLASATAGSQGSSGVSSASGAGGKEAKGKIGGYGGGGTGRGAGPTEGELKTGKSASGGDQYGILEKIADDIIDFSVGEGQGTGGQAGKIPDIKNIVVTRTTRGIVTRFPNNIFFDTGSAKLLPGALPLLEKLGRFIIKKNYRVEIEGHTDNVPIRSREFPSNWELSATRAVNVLRFLLARFKIPPDRVSALGFGDQKPRVPNTSKANRAKNRRVVIVLYRDRT